MYYNHAGLSSPTANPRNHAVSQKGMTKPVVTLMCALAMSGLMMPAQAGWINSPDNPLQLQATSEVGLIQVLAHTIQFGANGTTFDYVKDGNQNLLFPYSRLGLNLGINHRHNIVLVYQPIDVRTEAVLEEPLVVDSLTFLAGTPMDFRYGFDFYRVSYLYNFLRDPEQELGVGVSLQMRDATISFSSKDGTQSLGNQNVGPVPVLKARARFPLGGQSWLGAEVDGFYASDKIFNGANFKFEGSVLDASLRYGIKFSDAVAGYINGRYIGGSAKGFGYKNRAGSDGYTDNRLNTFALSIAFELK